MNREIGSALAGIVLTVPVVVPASIVAPIPNGDWLRVFEVPVPILGWAHGTGRTYAMQGAVHLVRSAAFGFLAFVP